jgi:hypothetical protein
MYLEEIKLILEISHSIMRLSRQLYYLNGVVSNVIFEYSTVKLSLKKK